MCVWVKSNSISDYCLPPHLSSVGRSLILCSTKCSVMLVPRGWMWAASPAGPQPKKPCYHTQLSLWLVATFIALFPSFLFFFPSFFSPSVICSFKAIVSSPVFPAALEDCSISMQELQRQALWSDQCKSSNWVIVLVSSGWFLSLEVRHRERNIWPAGCIGQEPGPKAESCNEL